MALDPVEKAVIYDVIGGPANLKPKDMLYYMNPSYITNPYPYASPKNVPSGYEPTLMDRAIMYSEPKPIATPKNTTTPKNVKYPIVNYAPNLSAINTPFTVNTLSPGASSVNTSTIAPEINPPRSVPRSTPRVSVGNVTKGTLGFLGLAAVADALYNKDASALAYLFGMGPGSLVASSPVNAGEDEQLALMHRRKLAEQAYQEELAQKRQNPNLPKDTINGYYLLDKAMTYNENLKNAIQKGKDMQIQEYPQMAIQGTSEVAPETDTIEETNLNEAPIKYATETATSAPVESNTVPDNTVPVKQGSIQRNRTSLLSTPELTRAILNNEFGNGKERIANLTAQGYSPAQIKAAQDQINGMARPVRSRAPVQQRRVAPTLAEAVMYNRPDTVPVQVPATNANINPSGYTKGHEAVFNPRTGRLEFI